MSWYKNTIRSCHHGCSVILHIAFIFSIPLVVDNPAVSSQRSNPEPELFVSPERMASGMKPPFIVIMHGVSGSGKSTLARWLAEETGAIWISSDIERKQLFGLQPEDSSVETGLDIYTFQASRRTFRHIEKIADRHLAADQSVILDATFLKAAWRKPFIKLADEYQTHPVILSCSTTTECLVQRVKARKAQGVDPSEAGVSVVRAQLKQFRPIPVSEGLVVRIDTQKPFPEQQQLVLDGIRQAMSL